MNRFYGPKPAATATPNNNWRAATKKINNLNKFTLLQFAYWRQCKTNNKSCQ